MAANEDYSSDSNEEFFDVKEENSFILTQGINSDMAKGSEEIKEMYCHECEKHDNSYIPAEGLCLDCVEYKCKTCLKFHRRHSGNHHIQNKDSMPQDFCFERCTNHPKELIKFYCVKCEDFACCECQSAHQNCPNLKHLPSLVKDIEDSEELKEFKENLKKISKDIDIIKDNLQLKSQLAHTMESRAKATIVEHNDKLTSTYHQYQKETLERFDQKMEETIDKLRKEREDLVDQLEETQTNFNKNLMNSEQEVMNKVKEQKQFLELLEAKQRTLTNDVADISKKIMQAQSSGQRCNLFLALKTSKETFKTLKKNINDLKMQDIQYVKIEPVNPEVSQISLEQTKFFFSFKEYNLLSKRIASFTKNICTKSTKESCLCLLSPNKLIETDYSGKCIYMVENISNSKPHIEIKMPSNPCGIAKVGENKVAVTFPSEGTVRLITFSESMTVVKSEDITVGALCRGIAYCNDKLIVSYISTPGKVQIFDMAGNVLNCFEKDLNGQHFSSTDYLALSPDNKTLYVSDRDRHTVTSMTLDGKVNAIYKDDQLKGPWQLTVDEIGTVYVCGKLSNNVHQLSPDLTKVKILLDKSQGMVKPVSIAYCQNNSRLYVGTWNSIKVFNLSTE